VSSALITGIGYDLIEVARIQKELDKEGNPALRDRLFTTKEIHYCEGKAFPAQHYAARFAAKEALFKALGLGQRDGMGWQDVEVDNDPLGRPLLTMHGKAKEFIEAQSITRVHVSLCHLKDVASAVVLLEQ
jgi:holo-[acyl-carrier protein] synthase